ncbi:MAG: radA [Chlamydiales bacterium]|nr:radA [Chlamydiales bacterium]
MAKTKIVWSCSACGHTQHKWTGQCPQCQNWNTLEEFKEVQENSSRHPTSYTSPQDRPKPVRVKDVNFKESSRMTTLIKEFDRLIGGGIVNGSFSLVGGDPGIGKSTILLQISNSLAQQGRKVLYVCGEESVAQTSMRALRLGLDSDNLFLLSETSLEQIKTQVTAIKPDFLVVDSIQIIYKSEIPSSPGSVAQVRETATDLMHLAKGANIATFIIGHVTKSGEIAGPRILEHLVDTVLYFEGEQQNNYRIMRVVKNRFGPTDEIAVFQMHHYGLKEVPNPSELFLEERTKGLPGSVIIPTVEGTRPILVELQSLVTKTVFSTPSRRCTGLDQNRLALLLAVLEKRLGFQLYQCDVFVSVAGGLKILEPAADLGIVLAITSSFRNTTVPADTIVVGEVGLGGEIRSVSRVETRIKEAIHMGFRQMLIPKRNLKSISVADYAGIKLVGVEFVEEAIHAILGTER